MSDAVAVDLLKRVAEFFREDPKRWTQGNAARDRFGVAVSERDETAVCWCAIGVVWRLQDSPQFAVAEAALKRLRRAIRSDNSESVSVGAWNDYSWRSIEEVIAIFEKAAELPA